MLCLFDIDFYEFFELCLWDVIGIFFEVYGFKNKLFCVQFMKVVIDVDCFNIVMIYCIEYDYLVYDGMVQGIGGLLCFKFDDNVFVFKNVMFILLSFVNTGYGLFVWEVLCFILSIVYDIEYKLCLVFKWMCLMFVFCGI